MELVVTSVAQHFREAQADVIFLLVDLVASVALINRVKAA